MNRIDTLFTRLKSEGSDGRPAMIAYITGGDPTLAASAKVAIAMEQAGVDILELGIPFSDPLADGATIQAAAGRALASGASVAGIIDLIREIRKTSQIPIVLFAYLNPVYIYGFEKFQQDAAEAGADGLLLLDLPPKRPPVTASLPPPRDSKPSASSPRQPLPSVSGKSRQPPRDSSTTSPAKESPASRQASRPISPSAWRPSVPRPRFPWLSASASRIPNRPRPWRDWPTGLLSAVPSSARSARSATLRTSLPRSPTSSAPSPRRCTT